MAEWLDWEFIGCEARWPLDEWETRKYYPPPTLYRPSLSIIVSTDLYVGCPPVFPRLYDWALVQHKSTTARINVTHDQVVGVSMESWSLVSTEWWATGRHPQRQSLIGSHITSHIMTSRGVERLTYDHSYSRRDDAVVVSFDANTLGLLVCYPQNWLVTSNNNSKVPVPLYN